MSIQPLTHVVVPQNISSKDKLPSQSNFKDCAVATVTASSSTNSTLPSNVLDNNENTKWTSKGIGQWLMLNLAEECDLQRLDIEWDPSLPRTGTYKVQVAMEDNLSDLMDLIPTTAMNTALFASITTNEEIMAHHIKIICNGNAEDDYNGITEIGVYGFI